MGWPVQARELFAREAPRGAGQWLEPGSGLQILAGSVTCVSEGE